MTDDTTTTITSEAGTVVGHIETRDGVRTYVTPRDRSAHLYQFGQGYPIDEHVLDECRDHNVERIVIEDDTGTLQFDIEQYIDGEFIDFVGPQRYVPLNDATVVA